MRGDPIKNAPHSLEGVLHRQFEDAPTESGTGVAVINRFSGACRSGVGGGNPATGTQRAVPSRGSYRIPGVTAGGPARIRAFVVQANSVVAVAALERIERMVEEVEAGKPELDVLPLCNLERLE